MKHFKPCLLIVLLALISFWGIGILPAEDGGSGKDTKSYSQELKKSDKTVPQEKLIELKNRLCPVDFKKITPDVRYPYTYKDKIYFFHSPECIEEFKKDPEGYLKAWEKKERFYKINIIYD